MFYVNHIIESQPTLRSIRTTLTVLKYMKIHLNELKIVIYHIYF